MPLLFYSLSVCLYAALIAIVAPFNSKAKKWKEGRKGIIRLIKDKMQGNSSPIAWFHCASLGEFEQARTVLEGFRRIYPDYKIVLTFFSPSGYEVRKNYPLADYIFYLPLDTKANASSFIDAVKPNIALFVKYEFWHFYISELKKRNVPVISFSAIFRKEQLFFKPYGGFYRNILKNLSAIFVQDSNSKELLNSIGIASEVAGDTRFDRVKEIAANVKAIPLAEKFKNEKRLLVIGSAWMQDMEVLMPCLNKIPDLKIIIAPHEIKDKEIELMVNGLSSKKSVRYSQAQEDTISSYDVLIIDNIGILSSLYQYANYAYIGGAFGKGLHNILEAATFGMPILFGTNYQRFKEAIDLIAGNCAFSIIDTTVFERIFASILEDEEKRLAAVRNCKEYIASHTGATEKILTACRAYLK